jgi:hypothetical protein
VLKTQRQEDMALLRAHLAKPIANVHCNALDVAHL